MRSLAIVALLLTGCAAHKISVDMPTPDLTARAKSAAAEPLASLLPDHQPACMLKSNQKLMDAVRITKMSDGMSGRCWVFFEKDHMYGYFRWAIKVEADGRSGFDDKNTVYRPVGTWKE